MFAIFCCGESVRSFHGEKHKASLRYMCIYIFVYIYIFIFIFIFIFFLG